MTMNSFVAAFASCTILFLVSSCDSTSPETVPELPLSDSVVDAPEQIIISDDIQNFWVAFDSVQSTDDTIKQLELFTSLFLDNASEGQQRMIEARNYTPEEYLKSIRSFPKFWASLRPNTEHMEGYYSELDAGVQQLHSIYPNLEPSTIYFTVGAHRSPGTGVDSYVLIGTEFALGDLNTNTTEMPDYRQAYYKIDPVKQLRFLTVHEYVHTQQNEMVFDLLSLTLYEGIADFVASTATGETSPFKAFAYGPENDEAIKAKFEQDMFNPNTIFNWLWNSPDNEFGTSDLAYYVGHKVASIYYDKAEDKQEAIRKLIELDYTNTSEVEALVNSTGYFSTPVSEIRETYISDTTQSAN